MAQMVIRGIDEKVMAALKAFAKRNGTSAEGEARRVLSSGISMQMQREQTVKKLQSMHKQMLKRRGGKFFPDSTAMIRKDRAERD